MKLSGYFAKPVDRHIEGVIKADDEASLRLEVEEYVLTNEIAKGLDQFLTAYNNFQGANGAWISGFFGSGKSHLLKMLALLLENRVVEGVATFDAFMDKPELQEDSFLQADLKNAIAIPSQSVLFNIDQKADVIHKGEFDALLAVFVKVFDEMCGYFGKQGYIAQFERDLDSRGQYEAFKETFQEIAGIAWTAGREQALLESHNIDSAYAQITGVPLASAQGILDKYRAEYRLSIEDFAKQVDAYIQQQGPDFRLNFFVDEVGQYIADNIKLMTNLQTVAESLATKSRGRAWIVVTAQEDMTTVLGEMDRQQANDFSKIQARFANRLKLTSADVEEVIRKRLLAKNTRGQADIGQLYEEQKNNFGMLFDFGDGAQTYRNFRDEGHFVGIYPFIPYQFVLFQSAIQSLSQHNAFEGQHRSVGERSMLEVFQHVAMEIADHQLGQLATFDLMFEGIRNTIQSQIKRSIKTAEDHLGDPFAIRLLKSLFLVKYVKEFKATPRNLTVLMLDSFHADLPALRKQVEQALDLLEQQTYIQRHGEEYEFLTDEEKDVEQDIKNTEVETDAVAEELGKLVFDYVIRDRKIRYETNGQDYSFSRRIDDRLLGREQELGIKVISPFNEYSDNETLLRAQSMGRDDLLVIMPASVRLVRDLGMYKRTEKYIRQNSSITQQDTVRRILNDKSLRNQERHRTLQRLVEELLGKSKLIVNGQDVESGSSDGKTRVVEGFHSLLVRTYPNLRMLRGITYSQDDIGKCLQSTAGLLGDDPTTFSEAEQEMMAFLQENQRSGQRTTMLSLVNRFEKKPYGWYLAAIQCGAAKLHARGKIEATQDSNLLESGELEKALTNTQGFGNLILAPQIDFSAAQVRRLKDFYGDFFDEPPHNNEAKSLAQETAASLALLHTELEQMRGLPDQYPFLSALDRPIRLLQEVTGKPYTFYLKNLGQHEDELFDSKESVIDPLRDFMSGPQRQIYDEARRFLDNQAPNLSHVDGGDAQAIRVILADPTCYQDHAMTRLKGLLNNLQEQVQEQVQQEREEASQALQSRWQRLAAMDDFQDLSPEQQEVLRQPFDELGRTVQVHTLIAVIRDELRSFEEQRYPQLLGQMSDWLEPESETDPESGPVIEEPRYEYVPSQSLAVPFKKAWLADEADVDAYLKALKEALMQAIAEGKRVQV
ncbi:MAG: BREX system P-loop protein BrxC [Chloroflexota bacterium]|nr:BREX system P-loop protein BrxC [Chloroflexota bacterium]